MPRRKRKTSAATPRRSVNNTYKEGILYQVRNQTLLVEIWYDVQRPKNNTAAG
jgi:hypothetical protein